MNAEHDNLTPEELRDLAESYAPAMPRELTKVTLGGVQFYLDTKLGELRQVDNPHNRIPL